MILFPLAVVGAVVLAAEVWARLGNPRPGTTRRLVHLAGGAAAASLGFFTGSVLVVAGVAALIFLTTVAAHPRALAARRATAGAELVPIVVVTTFGLADGDAWLYLGAMLVPGAGDAVAALVGARPGRIGYRVWGERRTLEGSLAFLAATLPCLALAGAGWGVALLAGAICTAIEALSPRGTGTLTLPVAACLLVANPTIAAPAAVVLVGLLLPLESGHADLHRA